MPCKWFHLLLSTLCWTKQSPPSFTFPSQLGFPTSFGSFDHNEEISVSYPLFFTGRGWQLWEWTLVQKQQLWDVLPEAWLDGLFILSLCRTHALITLIEVSSLGELFRKKDAVNISWRLFLQRNTSCRDHFLSHCTTWFASAVRWSVAPQSLCGCLFWYVHGEWRVCTCSLQPCSTLGGSWTFAQLGRDCSFPPAPIFIYFSVGRWQCWWFLLSWIYVKSLFAAVQRSQHVARAQANRVPWLNQFLREGVS